MISLQRRRLKSLFVDTPIQRALLSNLSVVWVGYHLILFHALLLSQYLADSSDPTRGVIVPLAEYYSEFAARNVAILWTGALALPIIAWQLLVIAHRISAPLQRFKHALRRMATGRTPRKIQLRQRDLLQDLQEEFNHLVDQYERQGEAETPPVRIVPSTKRLTTSNDLKFSAGHPAIETDRDARTGEARNRRSPR